jgi:large subunit ribosomal protein L15
MRLNRLSDNPGARHRRMRVGRGIGSGKGKTAGRGHKGQKARTGVSLHGFEGGQMPLHRRLPKRGFKMPFRRRYQIINLGALQKAVDAGRLAEGANVDGASLVAAGILSQSRDGIRLLGKGDIKVKLSISVAGASKSAIAAIEKAGGSVTLSAPVPSERMVAAANDKKAAKARRSAAKSGRKGAAPEADRKDAAPKADRKDAAPKADRKGAAPKADRKSAAPEADAKA